MTYRLAWSWHEESVEWLLEHPDKTENEFKEDCIRALREVGKDYINKTECWIGAPDWIEEAFKKLIEYGYKDAEPEVVGTFSHFGSYILEGLMNDDNTEPEDDKKWKEIVGNELYDKAVKKNRELYKILKMSTIKRMNNRWYATYFKT